MQLFPVSNGQRVAEARGRYNGVALQLLNNVVDNALNTPGSYLGVNDAPLRCGGLVVPKDSVFTFVKNDKAFSPVIGLQVPGNRRIMTFVYNSANGIICPYDAKLRESPSPIPTESDLPKVSPSSIATLPPTATSTVAPMPSVTAMPSTTTTAFASMTASPSATATATQSDGDATATPSKTPTPASEGGESVCFPGSASVDTPAGRKLMSQLSIGDLVRVSSDDYSPVFMFTHRLTSTPYDFVRITTESGASIALTRSHYLHVDATLKAARDVAIGDQLTLADGSRSVVATIAMERSIGLYNPQTVHGSIVVDGVLASTYTRTVAPGAAHSLLAPLRMLYNALGMSTCSLEGGADTMARALPKGTAIY